MKYKTIISFGSNWYIFIYTSTFDIFKLELSFFVPFAYVILTYVFAGSCYDMIWYQGRIQDLWLGGGVWFIHWKHMIRPFLFIDKQKRKLSANPYINQRTHPTCIYNVYEYFTTGHKLTIHEKFVCWTT